MKGVTRLIARRDSRGWRTDRDVAAVVGFPMDTLQGRRCEGGLSKGEERLFRAAGVPILANLEEELVFAGLQIDGHAASANPPPGRRVYR